MPGKKPIVVVGSINTDLVSITSRIPSVGETVIGSDFQIHPGGKGANQAVAVAQLGYPVRLIGRLGNDSFGTQLRKHLVGYGVDIEGVGESEGTSGVAVIVVSHEGANSIVVTPGANAEVTPQDLEKNIEAIRGAGIVLAQLEIPLETVVHLAALCEREGVPLILDPAPAAELPAEVFRRLTWLTPNQAEADFYMRRTNGAGKVHTPAEVAHAILSKGSQGVLLKLGEHGVHIISQAGLDSTLPAFHVTATDTTGAGDAFNGGFATGLMLGKSPLASVRFATAVAAISVTRRGAQPSMPTASEVQEFLELEQAIGA